MAVGYYRDPVDGTFKPLVAGAHHHDSQYVNITGDTMTGPLNIAATATATAEVRVADTGWRVVTSSAANGWTASGLTIRRVGSQVTLRVSGLSGADQTAKVFYFAPAGFWASPHTVIGLLGTAQVAGALVRQVTGLTASQLQVPQSTTGDASLSGTLTWFTDEPWPTSLP